MSEGIKNFTPREIMSELDRYVIGQKDAKRAVAIAMRNRWRRQQVESSLRDEIMPKNIIMIGATGVGKTEIARRLSKLANAPFIKVEASKFTEVGYVGKDVESMIRELTEIAVNMAKDEFRENIKAKAAELAEEHLLDLLIPKKPKKPPVQKPVDISQLDMADIKLMSDEILQENIEDEESDDDQVKVNDPSREKMREMLRSGKLDNRSVEFESSPQKGGMGFPMIEVVTSGGNLEDLSKNIRDMFSNVMGPKQQKRKKVKVPEALNFLIEEESQKLIDMDVVVKEAIDRVQQSGIVFIDEIDKIASRDKSGHGPDISREGVQRDILPIVEGSRVNTKFGTVCTDHILFIAAGAFHVSKPSDLIPELQGRFPIRVELQALTEPDFLRILTEPEHSLTKQYVALMKTEGVDLNFSADGLKEVAHFAALANQQMENIGARRLHTILEKVLDDVSFTASEMKGEKFEIDSAYVKKCLDAIIKNQDLSRYIL
ncbi:MAG: hypothetical protein ACD_73C00135G0002 [uncultured bacterium]|nr:MAG: hypothetical protein ACD_73C00135G0002 [uncultured bacterium]